MLLSRRIWSVAYVAVLAIVAVLSLLPEVRHPAGSDVLSHLIAYTAASVCAGLAFRSMSARIAAAAAMLLTGAALEIVQSALPGRVASLGDALVNAAGVGLGLTLAHLVLRAVPPFQTAPATHRPAG